MNAIFQNSTKNQMKLSPNTMPIPTRAAMMNVLLSGMFFLVKNGAINPLTTCGKNRPRKKDTIVQITGATNCSGIVFDTPQFRIPFLELVSFPALTPPVVLFLPVLPFFYSGAENGVNKNIIHVFCVFDPFAVSRSPDCVLTKSDSPNTPIHQKTVTVKWHNPAVQNVFPNLFGVAHIRWFVLCEKTAYDSHERYCIMEEWKTGIESSGTRVTERRLTRFTVMRVSWRKFGNSRFLRARACGATGSKYIMCRRIPNFSGEQTSYRA